MKNKKKKCYVSPKIYSTDEELPFISEDEEEPKLKINSKSKPKRTKYTIKEK